MNKHTKGPWAASESGLIGAGPQFLHIAQTVTTGMGHAAAANSRLIAAAPELLEALELALRSMERTCTQYDTDPATDTECRIVRAAINKALEG